MNDDWTRPTIVRKERQDQKIHVKNIRNTNIVQNQQNNVPRQIYSTIIKTPTSYDAENERDVEKEYWLNKMSPTILCSYGSDQNGRKIDRIFPLETNEIRNTSLILFF